MPDTKFIIETHGISKFYGSVVALDGVDFELKDGEVLGLVGDNGAGKSTLIKILSGAELPNEGSIEVFGKPVHIRNPRDSFELGIETIYQDLALFDNLNFTLTQSIGDYIKVKFQAKNLTNPTYETAYRTGAGDFTRTSFRRGIDYTIGISAEITF